MPNPLKTLLIPLVLAGLSGCEWGQSGGPLTVTQSQDLRLNDVAEILRTYQESYKKPPKSFRDYARIGDAAAPTGIDSVRDKQIIVRWNATLPDLAVEPTSPPSDEVLAYPRDVPEKGGSVLMLDRRIRQMTPEEFKAAKLAGSD